MLDALGATEGVSVDGLPGATVTDRVPLFEIEREIEVPDSAALGSTLTVRLAARDQFLESNALTVEKLLVSVGLLSRFTVSAEAGRELEGASLAQFGFDRDRAAVGLGDQDAEQAQLRAVAQAALEGVAGQGNLRERA